MHAAAQSMIEHFFSVAHGARVFARVRDGARWRDNELVELARICTQVCVANGRQK